MKVVYHAPEGEEDVTTAFGILFQDGKSVDVTDEKALAKLKGHPNFHVGGEKAKPEDGNAAQEERAAKISDGRSKEARAARAAANEAQQEAEAKERAAEHALGIREAIADKAQV